MNPSDSRHQHRTAAQATVGGGARRTPWVAAFLAVAIPTATLHADAVKLEGFWIQDVIVDHINETHIVYVSGNGSEVSRAIDSVQGLYLTAYPELEQAEQALEAGDHTTARAPLEKANNRASEPWLKHWVSRKLLRVYDQVGEPLRLADTVAALARGGAPAGYLADVPVSSFTDADQPARDEAVRRLQAAQKLVRDPAARDAVGRVVESIAALGPSVGSNADGRPQPDHEQPANTASTGPDGGGSQTNTPALPRGSGSSDRGGSRSGIVLPNAIDRNNQTIRLLLSSEAALAVKSANQQLEKGDGQTAMYLYLRGMAQATVGDDAGDHDAYLDAGLSFMDVVVNYPASIYAGPSLVELGYVHEKIGRADKARQLYATASESLDNEEEPRYVQRLAELRQGVGQ